MSSRKNPDFKHVTRYGQTILDVPQYIGPIPQNFTFNSPVGVCMDRCQQIWVCDTGNNRVVILDRDMQRVIRILHCPDPENHSKAGKKADGALTFHMPFHVCPHPQQNRVYITDIGNSRVVVMDYDNDEFDFAFAFGNDPRLGLKKLQDPNGITLVKQKQGGYQIHVNDEFFHTKTEPRRNRCVRFDENGNYIDEFRTVISPDGERHDLYWPQGLASDAQGNLYIANTGSYEVLKCPANSPVQPDYSIAAQQPIISHTFADTSGIGMLNIMRYVNVIGERVFVPDHVANTISVLDLDGQPVSSISGLRPCWKHATEEVDSLTDPIYYALEDSAIVSPYVICQGEAPDIFLVSEPFCSRILKLRISNLDQPEATASILAAIGSRRDEKGNRRIDAQFNCVTSVMGLQRNNPPRPDSGYDVMSELPAYLRYNPLQRCYMGVGALMASQYDWLWKTWSWLLPNTTQASASFTAPPLPDSLRLNVDAGNWDFQHYVERGGDFSPLHNPLAGYFMPGNLAMAVYHPRTPLLGQLCPGTPLLLVSNFNFGMVSLYQVGPLGKLLNYGVPFGFPGSGQGCLNGPQGMAVSDDGEAFVVDTLNNRMTKWQILQTGQVVFISSFVWPAEADDAADYRFTPTDVEIDADNRVFVTDQFNNRICVFDRHGNPLWRVGQQGYWEEDTGGDGDDFMLPTSLAIDGEHLVVNDLVNRALKIFRIQPEGLEFATGISLFKRSIDAGGVWMPYFMYARDRQVFVADSTYNVVQVYSY